MFVIQIVKEKKCRLDIVVLIKVRQEDYSFQKLKRVKNQTNY